MLERAEQTFGSEDAAFKAADKYFNELLANLETADTELGAIARLWFAASETVAMKGQTALLPQ